MTSKGRFGFYKTDKTFTCRDCKCLGVIGQHRLYDNEARYGPLCMKCAEKRGYVREDAAPVDSVSATSPQVPPERIEHLASVVEGIETKLGMSDAFYERKLSDLKSQLDDLQAKINQLKFVEQRLDQLQESIIRDIGGPFQRLQREFLLQEKAMASLRLSVESLVAAYEEANV